MMSQNNDSVHVAAVNDFHFNPALPAAPVQRIVLLLLVEHMVGNILTTRQCADICKVSPRTVALWFDSGRLRGYRIPGSQDRRIPKEYLIRFMKEHGMPIPDGVEDEPTSV